MDKIQNIHKSKKKTLIIFCICSTALIIAISLFLFYIIDNNNTAINIIKNKNIKEVNKNKLMSNPRIRFEYENGDFYYIKGKKAEYKSNGNIKIHNVTAISNKGNIKSRNLEITDNGNIITFTGNPNLEFYSVINPNKK